MFLSAILLLLLAVTATAARGPSASDCPHGTLPAYAHNDYLNAHPLLDALSLGYKGAEADVFLVNGELQLGHKRRAAEEDGRFETLYLEPLRSLVAACGSLTVDGQPFLLTVEIKEVSRPTYDTLVALLTRYSDLLTGRDGGKPPVQVVLVGWYPGYPGWFADSTRLPLTRQTQLTRDDRPPADAADRSVGLISIDFSKTMGRWWVTPRIRRRWLAAIRMTKTAYPALRIRVYHLPVDERTYRALLEAGVDLIGTQELSRSAPVLNALLR
jgi:hypothetical protein